MTTADNSVAEGATRPSAPAGTSNQTKTPPAVATANGAIRNVKGAEIFTDRSPVAAEKASPSSEKDAAVNSDPPPTVDFNALDVLGSRLAYRDLGWWTFPAPLGAKKSHKAEQFSGTKWGSTLDPDEIRADCARWPHANVGIVTGSASSFFVVEIDTVKGHNVDGDATLAVLTRTHGPLPETVAAVSPSGSRHFYLRMPADGEGVKNSEGKIGPGIDVRGDGGMVLGVPSVKPGKGVYRWMRAPGTCELAECPQWLLELARKPALGSSKRSKSAGPIVPPTMSLADIAACLRCIDPGTGYDDWKDVLMAVHSASGGSLDGMFLVDFWSSFDTGQYEDALVAEKWGGFSAEGGITAWTLLKKARDPATTPDADLWDDKYASPEPEWQWGSPVDLLAIEGRLTPSAADEFDDCDLEAVGERPVFAGEISEVAFAAGFTARNPHTRYDHTRARWVVWDSQRWAVDESGSVSDRMFHLARTAARGLQPKERRSINSTGFVGGAERRARVDRAHATTSASWDIDPWLLGTPGGTVDLTTGELRPAEPNQMITKLTAVAPADGEPRRWLRFLREATTRTRSGSSSVGSDTA